VANVTLNLTGTVSSSTSTDTSGNYQFLTLPSGGTYNVTPAKAPRTPGVTGINTIDIIAVQRHFLGIILLTGCPLAAADVNADGAINTVDVIAIQRFFLSLSTGTANTGSYQFTPTNRTYQAVTTNQTAQDYNVLIFGDVASPFVNP
jgi:hypothetical protein